MTKAINIDIYDEEIIWGNLDISLFELSRDWYGEELEVPVSYGLAADEERFWFVVMRNKPACLHPDSRPEKFMPDLWKYDIGELFIGHPEHGRYLEFHLSPNGAWWNADFVAPRQRASLDEKPMQGVKTYHHLSASGDWVAAASLPLDHLIEHYDLGYETRMNITFALDDPMQRFLSVAPPLQTEPDFHRPDVFLPIDYMKKEMKSSHADD